MALRHRRRSDGKNEAPAARRQTRQPTRDTGSQQRSAFLNSSSRTAYVRLMSVLERIASNGQQPMGPAA